MMVSGWGALVNQIGGTFAIDGASGVADHLSEHRACPRKVRSAHQGAAMAFRNQRATAFAILKVNRQVTNACRPAVRASIRMMSELEQVV